MWGTRQEESTAGTEPVPALTTEQIVGIFLVMISATICTVSKRYLRPGQRAVVPEITAVTLSRAGVLGMPRSLRRRVWSPLDVGVSVTGRGVGV